MFFMRWYGLKEADIDSLTFQKMLNYAQGIMVFEESADSRGPLPMTDAAGMRQFEDGKKKRLEALWNIMFPISRKYIKELHDKSEERRGQLAALRGMVFKEK